MDADRCWLWDDARQCSVGPFESERAVDIYVNQNDIKTFYVMSGPLNGYPMELLHTVKKQAA